MKETKICVIATIIVAIIIYSCAYAIPAGAEAGRPEFYPKLAIVTGATQVEENLWVIECEDRKGNKWEFYDDEGEWEIGDIANLLMWNIGKAEEDHEIVEVYWEGYTDEFEFFFEMDGWRQ